MTRVVLSLLTAFLFVAAYMLSLFLVAMAGERAGEWRAVRNAYAASHPACAACGAKADLQVHHVKPFHLWPALELESSNLIALCPRCHLLLGHLGDYRAYNPCVREDAAWMLARVKSRPYTRDDAAKFQKQFSLSP